MNTYYVVEYRWCRDRKWNFDVIYDRLQDAIENTEANGLLFRIVRYSGNKLPKIVRQYDADGKRVV